MIRAVSLVLFAYFADTFPERTIVTVLSTTIPDEIKVGMIVDGCMNKEQPIKINATSRSWQP